jgi:hypothetical protein
MEIVGWSRSACRRYKMHVEVKDKRWVYGQNCEQCHHLPPRLNVIELWEVVQQWRILPCNPHRMHIRHGQATGISGESPLWRISLVEILPPI